MPLGLFLVPQQIWSPPQSYSESVQEEPGESMDSVSRESHAHEAQLSDLVGGHPAGESDVLKEVKTGSHIC